MTKLYYTIFNFVALSVVIYTGVDIFYRIVCSRLMQVNTSEMVVQQVPDIEQQKKSPLNDFRVITGRNIFGSLEKASKEVKTEEIDDLEPTTLKVALLGTVATGDQENARAVILETVKRKQGLYKVGDSIQEGTVKKILRKKVIFRVGDKDEILTMEESASPKGIRVSPSLAPIGRPSTITVSRSELQKSLEDINQLLSQVRIRPHYKDGKADGLVVSRIMRGSIFSKLGLRDRDIVQKINGRPINSPDDILSLYEKLKSGSHFSLDITRRGKGKKLNYRFK
jgi:general secretion pathway protein C